MGLGRPNAAEIRSVILVVAPFKPLYIVVGMVGGQVQRGARLLGLRRRDLRASPSP